MRTASLFSQRCGIASSESALSPLLGILISMAFIHVFSFKPFKENRDNTLSVMLTYSLTFIFLGALMIRLDALPDRDFEKKLFEVTLVVVFALSPVLIAADLIFSVCTSHVPARDVDSSNAKEARRSQAKRSLVKGSRNPVLLRRTGGSPCKFFAASVGRVEWSQLPLIIQDLDDVAAETQDSA
jgi:hypothetical protein